MSEASPGPRPGASSDALARVNRTRIVELLRADGPLARQQIGERTGLSPATVNRLTAALLTEQVVTVAGQQPSGGGRPSVLLRYAGERRLIAAVQVHAQGASGALVDLDGRVAARRTRDVPRLAATGDEEQDRARQLDVVLPLLDHLIDHARELGTPAVAVAVAAPGTVEADSGSIAAMPYIGWLSLELGRLLRERYAMPAAVENDANAFAYGELRRGAGGPSLVAVLVEEGVGAGIVADGRLLHGARWEAGEIGFLLVDRGALGGAHEDRGDLETRIGPLALARSLQKRGVALPDGPVTPQRVLELAARGVPGAGEVAARVLDLLALGVAAVATVLDPEVVVLGSGMDAAVDAVRGRLESRIMRVPRIVPSSLGADGVLVGIAELAAVEVNSFAYLHA